MATNVNAAMSKNKSPLPSTNRNHPPPSSAARSKLPSSRRSITPTSRPTISLYEDDSEPARVRVSVRVRPRNDDDLLSDADSYDCLQLQPEVKKLKLIKNNWSSDSYKFDEVLTETASQKRVYEVVAKPVVESVLNGYNGTVMAYGQTGTGKTYTLGRLGKEDPSECGIMVRAMKDIFATPGSFTVEVSYLQLYLESVQDLLLPEKNNIPIGEDPKTGEVSLPGAEVIKVRDLDHFLQLLQIGEANRHAANTKLNTESSRSHAILMVYIQQSSQGKVENDDSSLVSKTDFPVRNGAPIVIRSKLLIVDLAGSERINKSGSEGHMLEEAKFINLSLTSLGKCINALAENSPHIPTRDSKLTRLLRDSFGGSARTSLVITIGPSSRYHAETASTIMFGQRAMKIVNMVKIKEEYDYESLCRKLENQVDYLTAELERLQKLREVDQNEMEKKIRDCQNSFAELEKSLSSESEVVNIKNSCLEVEIKTLLDELKLQRDHNDLMHDEVTRLETTLKQSKKQKHLENSTYQKVLAETTQMYEKKISELIEKSEKEHARLNSVQEQLNTAKKNLSDHQNSLQINGQKEIAELRIKLEESYEQQKKCANEVQSLRTENEKLISEKVQEQTEINELRMDVRQMRHLYEKTVNDFQRLRTQNDGLLSAKIQGENEIQKLKLAMQEMGELHDKPVDEFQILETKHEILLSEKEAACEELATLKQRLFKEEKERKYLEDEHAKDLDTLKQRLLKEEKERKYLEDEHAKELATLKQRLSKEEKERKYLEDEHAKLLRLVPEINDESEIRRGHSNGLITEKLPGLRTPTRLISGQRTTMAKIFDEVGLPKIVSMLSSEELEVQIHAVKVVANLASEDKNQEKIVEEGGLEALLNLLEESKNATIHRVASGAIANLAMKESNQNLIMDKGGAQLLANIAYVSDDSQTLRMVAGAIANLCGNQKLHVMLKEDGGIKALFKMVQSGNSDVIAQVARGLANFAKCESRGTHHGHRKVRSLLLEDGALKWLISQSSATTSSASTQRHIELALCHLAQNEENAGDFTRDGAVKELVRISSQSSKEDIRSLAKKILKSNPVFQAEMQRVNA